MFFCSPCAQANRWPESIGKSFGSCEECGKLAECNDVPSRLLPTSVFVITPPDLLEEGDE